MSSDKHSPALFFPGGVVSTVSWEQFVSTVGWVPCVSAVGWVPCVSAVGSIAIIKLAIPKNQTKLDPHIAPSSWILVGLFDLSSL